MRDVNPDFDISVAAVCGTEVRIYDDYGRDGRRQLLRVAEFQTHGAAVLYAQEFDDAERRARDARRR